MKLFDYFKKKTAAEKRIDIVLTGASQLDKSKWFLPRCSHGDDVLQQLVALKITPLMCTVNGKYKSPVNYLISKLISADDLGIRMSGSGYLSNYVYEMDSGSNPPDVSYSRDVSGHDLFIVLKFIDSFSGFTAHQLESEFNVATAWINKVLDVCDADWDKQLKKVGVTFKKNGKDFTPLSPSKTLDGFDERVGVENSVQDKINYLKLKNIAFQTVGVKSAKASVL